MTRHSMDRGDDPGSFGRVLLKADRAVLRVETILNAAAGWLILALMLLLVAVVVLRGTFDIPLRGQVDLVTTMVPCFAFLGLSYCYRLAGQVRMDIVLRTMPGRMRILAELIGALAATLVAVLLVIGTFRDVMRAWRFGDTTMDIQLVTWPARALILLGLTVFAFRMFVVVIGWLRALRDPDAALIGVPKAPKQTEPDDWIPSEP